MKLSFRTRCFWFTAVSLLVLVMITISCGKRRVSRLDLASLYNRAAQYHRPDRNPIIAIPGILGSKLTDDSNGILAWGAFEPGAADPETPEGARSIALPMDAEIPLRNLKDSVRPDGVLETVRIRLLGIPVDILAYAGVLATLGAGGYRDESLGLSREIDYGDDHFTCFQFDYDWRRDNVENAKRLHDFILEKKAYVRREYRRRFGIEKPEIRFDIAAHSMGALITRYFLMYGSQDLPGNGSLPELTWEGAAFVERVLLIGPPNAGSVDALIQLVRGKRFGLFLPEYPPAILGTFPSMYQLLPRSRHGKLVWDGNPDSPVRDLFDPELWRRMGWGLSDPSQGKVLEILMSEIRDPEKRKAIAAGYQKNMLQRAEAFQQALDRPANSPSGLQMILIAGDAYPTEDLVAVNSKSGRLQVILHAAGDGSVLRGSALMDERMGQAWSPKVRTPIDFHSILFLPERHLEMTSMDVFRDNVLFWLLEDDR